LYFVRNLLTSNSPYKFEAPWSSWEFAYHVLHKEANLVIVSMAWLTREDARSYSRAPKEPDMDTLSYWLARLEPLIRNETIGEIIVVFANRCGVEDDAVFAGTSAVLGIEDGEVKVYGILGRGERELLVVDTNGRPQAKLVSLKNSRRMKNKIRTCPIRNSKDYLERKTGISRSPQQTQLTQVNRSDPTPPTQVCGLTALQIQGHPTPWTYVRL
jgi:hypothetical protein